MSSTFFSSIQRFSAVFCGLFTLIALQASDPAWAAPKVLVTLPPQLWILKNIAGTAVEGVVLIPQNVNPHTFEPSIEQLRALRGVELYLKLSHPNLPLERAWLRAAQQENPRLMVRDVSERVSGKGSDPHFWLSSANMSVLIEATRDALLRFVPERGQEIEQRSEMLLKRVSALRAQLQRQFSHAMGMSFLVYHPAWGYFAREVGLVQLAIEENGKEPGAQDVMRVVQKARELGITTVFVEPLISPASAQVIARELNGKVAVLNPMAEEWELNLKSASEKILESIRHQRTAVRGDSSLSVEGGVVP